MDPNKALAVIRELVLKFHITDFAMNSGHPENDLADLVAHIESLDEWISKGGFLPGDWEKAQNGQ